MASSLIWYTYHLLKMCWLNKERGKRGRCKHALPFKQMTSVFILVSKVSTCWMQWINELQATKDRLVKGLSDKLIATDTYTNRKLGWRLQGLVRVAVHFQVGNTSDSSIPYTDTPITVFPALHTLLAIYCAGNSISGCPVTIASALSLVVI